MEKLLIVEDDIGIQKQLKWTLDDYDLHFAQDKKSAIATFRRHLPKVVILDLGLPPEPENPTVGMETLNALLALDPSCKIIVITGNDDRDTAREAIAMGAHDFYAKPIDEQELNIILRRAFFVANIELENAEQPLLQDSAILGSSQGVMHIRAMVSKVAPTPLTTLLLGESGTGKDLVAREIHQLSDRKEKPFIAINCASIPENLLESELFGYEKGAFTGAMKTTKGKIECANGGTLFLDEIGDMAYPLQAKILRFLQDKMIDRIGGRKPIEVDVRIVCATHQNLRSMVDEKSFREDLFYRISELIIDIPPLRDRDEDIVIIAKALLQQTADNLNKTINGFSQDAIAALLAYHWPGNIRELQNKIKSACILTDAKQIIALDLGLCNPENKETNLTKVNLRMVRENAEKDAIVKAMVYCDGNMSNTAKQLGVTRPTLYHLMKKYMLKQDSDTIKTQ